MLQLGAQLRQTSDDLRITNVHEALDAPFPAKP